jgi:hypothetical protein
MLDRPDEQQMPAPPELTDGGPDVGGRIRLADGNQIDRFARRTQQYLIRDHRLGHPPALLAPEPGGAAFRREDTNVRSPEAHLTEVRLLATGEGAEALGTGTRGVSEGHGHCHGIRRTSDGPRAGRSGSPSVEQRRNNMFL